MLRSLRHLLRLARMARTLARHDALFPLELVPPLRPWAGLVRRVLAPGAPPAAGREGERLARALRELGPAFVKLGQTLSTRTDLLGAAAAADLGELQDRLPPFPFEAARATVERELGRPLPELFPSFEAAPVAAASIAQVHKAVTADGRTVAVKILRPGIEAAVARDLDLLRWLAETAERLHPALRRLRLVETVDFLARSTEREMDLRLEAAAAEEFAANCRNDPGFRVPPVDWRRTARRVVTFGWEEGLRADRPDGLRAAGLDPSAIMERASVVFFNQVFRDGFFHADMHPGNMLIDPRDGTIVALDFGIMGRLDLPMRRSLAEMLLGFATRDYGLVAAVFFRLGLVPAHQDRSAFEQACRAVGEPILGLPLREISIARLFGQLLAVARDFEMTTRPELLLLQKTMVVSEGVGRTLDPGLNIWEVSEPLVADWMRTNLGPVAEARRRALLAADALGRLPGLVVRLDEALARAAASGPEVTAQLAGFAARAAGLLPFLLGAFLLGLLLG